MEENKKVKNKSEKGSSLFDFASIISIVIDDKNISRYLISIVSDKGDFFREIMVRSLNMNLADYITGIRFMIQELAISHDQIIYNTSTDIIDD